MNEGKPFVKGGLPRTILDGAGVTNTIADTLAHLYAKPSTIESSTEFQISGINGTASNNAKGTALSPSFHLPDIKLLKQNSASRLGSSLFGNNSDAAESVCKSSLVLGVSAKRKSDAVSSSLETSKRPQPKDFLTTTASQNATVSLSLSGKSPAYSNNGDLDNGSKKSSHHGSKLKKKEANTEKSTLSSSSAGESGEESGSDSSSTATSATSSVDSEGELNKKEQAEEACRQLQIAQLKEKRKELRKEVRKLKHANHEAATAKQNKGDQPMTLPKTIENPLPTNIESVVVASDNNDKSITQKPVTPTPVPSLAHSTIIVVPPTLVSPAPLAITPQKKTVTMQQETMDSSMPLDLCVKKSEPSPTRNDSQPLSLTMYDSGSAVTSTPLHFTAGLANSTQLNLSGINNSQSKKRGRKPKPLPGAITNHSDHSTPRGRPATDIYLNSSHSSRGDTFSISSLDISNLSALGSRGTHHHQLILPSPFSTIEGLKIPDLSNRVSSAASSSSSAATGRKRRCKVIPSRIVDYKDVNANKNSFGSDSRTLNKTTDNSVASSSSAHSVAGNSRTSDNKQYIMDHHNDGINHSTLQSGDHHRKREDERLGDSYSSSDSESSVDSGSESNSTGKSSTASSTQTGIKRHRTDRSESRAKKKKLLPDDKEIRIPLEYGWRRQTRMRCISRSGVKGEVCYYSPCGKKLRNYPEVIKYLQKNGINDIARENFSFNPKVIVGEYNERLPGNGPESNIMLSEQEVAARIEELRARKHLQNAQTAAAVISKLTGVTISSIPAAAHAQAHAAAHAAATQAANAVKRDLEAEEKQKKWEEIQMQRRIEQQAIARQNQKLRALRRAEQNNAAKESKRRKVEDIRRQKEHQKLVKQQEKMDKMEQQRMEKELRNQQLLEEREMKRQQAAILREQELQKRRDMLLMVDLERERRRQHMMLVRALETRKKTEERDKKNKEIIQEKEVQRLKKMEQRRLEMQLIREIKKPVDDMMLKDATPLPILNRIPGLKISAKAFGDLLMVFEFLHNFGETLGFDMENLPSLSTFQLALLNHDEKNEEELLSVVHHLLVCAIDDPGVPHPRSALTVLGQTLREVDITNNNISEVLRLYVNAVDRHCEVAQWLCEKPFLSLNPTKKAGVLAFLCHELLCSKIVVRQVDLSVDSVNNLKREKWVVEGQLRKLRGIQQRRKNQAAQLAQITENLAKDAVNQEEGNAEEIDGKSTPSGKSKNAKKSLVLPKEPEDDDDLDDLVIDSGNESDETQETGQPSEAEDDEPEVSNEELEKKIEKLTKVQNQFHNKLLKTNNSLRATTMGQDRYRRRYWILPKAGGIFVESLESSEILKTEIFPLESLEMRAEEEERLKLEKEKEEEEAKRKSEEEAKRKSEEEKDKPVEEKEEVPVKEVKEEETVDNSEEDKVVKVEQSEIKPKNKSKIIEPKEGVVEIIESPVKVEEKVVEDNSIVKQKEAKEIKRESEKLNEINSKKVSKSSVKIEPPIVLPDQKDLAQIPTDDKNNWLLHSPLFASILTGSLLMNSPLMHGREINGSYIGGIHAPIKGASTSTQSHAAAAAAAAAAATSEATFNPFMGLPPDFITAEQIMKHFTDSGNAQPPQRNWFSILPKIACDDSSLTLLPGQKAKVAVIPTEMPSTTASTSAAPSTSVVTVTEPPKIKAQTQTTPTTSSSKTASHSSKKESVANAAAQEGALKNLGPLGIFPPEVTNKITASALANLQLGLLNGIPPNILMHSFMAAHGIGPLYQSGNNSQVTPSNQPPVMNSLPSASNDDANSISLEKPSGCNTPNSIQMEADLATTQLDHPKRAMVERMQFDASKPIPLELQHGWWRITDINQLKEIFEALHSRGIREKIFHKQLEKYYNYATSVCYTNQMTVTDLEITDLDREISAKIGAAPDPDPSDYWLPAVALRVDLAILELVESLEDKIAGASMQIKRDLLNHPEQGWKVPPKLTSERAHLFNAACTFTPKPPVEKPDKRSSISAKTAAKELELAKKLEQSLAAAAAAEEAEREKDAIKNGEDDTIDADGDQEGVDIENPPSVVDSEKNDNDEDMEVDLEDDEDNYEARAPLNPVEVAQTRLLKVEAVIERRYIRPPLGTSTELNLSAATSSQSSYNSDEITPGLIKWRRAVQNCTTSAQLALCINMLENCIAWDKSIMRASCQFCHSGDNEEMLLLCDGCDKGYHTYCFKPKMETIPDGDWYCYECLNKATGDKVCIMCGKKGNKMLECEGCPKTFHMTCLEPPVTKAPKGRWACPNCSHKLPNKKSSSSKSKSKPDKDKKEPTVDKEASSKKSSNNNADTSANATASTSTSSKSSSSKEKKEKITKPQGNKDLAPCKIIIEELECHEDAWPFLLPVNVKQFPTYRKVIKKSMDLSTMKSKLETGIYKVREEFVTDARLIFDNCETFNEDDSPVGIAGHNMRAFFECRWSELCGI